VQQIDFLILSSLLAVLWQQWAAALEFTLDALNRDTAITGLDQAFNPELLERVSVSFLEWQRNFLIVSLGFILDTALFWTQIVLHHDRRFVPEAVAVYGVWIVTTVLIAAPFWISWRTWEESRLRALSELIHSAPTESYNLNAKLTALHDLRPFGWGNASAFALSIVTSFAAPLVQAFLRK
jgi:hypothetical protein